VASEKENTKNQNNQEKKQSAPKHIEKEKLLKAVVKSQPRRSLHQSKRSQLQRDVRHVNQREEHVPESKYFKN
jgi:hypothetical protein